MKELHATSGPRALANTMEQLRSRSSSCYRQSMYGGRKWDDGTTWGTLHGVEEKPKDHPPLTHES
jgi:hypothetical protein